MKKIVHLFIALALAGLSTFSAPFPNMVYDDANKAKTVNVGDRRVYLTGTTPSLSWKTNSYAITLSGATTFTFADLPTDTNSVRYLHLNVVGNDTHVLTNSANSILWRPTFPGVVPAGTNEIAFIFEGGVIHGYLGWRAIGADAVIVQTSRGLTNATLVNLSLTNDTLYALPQLSDGQIPKMTDTGLYTNAVEGVDYLDGGRIDDSPYDEATMDGVGDRVPSLNLFRDQVELILALINNAPGIYATNQTLDNVGTPIWTNSIANGYSAQVGARVLGAGSTNTYSFDTRATAKAASGTATMVGTNQVSTIPLSGTNMLAYWAVASSNLILYVRGFENETVNWTATNILVNVVQNGVDSSGPTYLFEENFEGAEAFTSGGSGTLDNAGWTATGTVVDADDTGTVLEGAETLFMNSGASPRVDITTTIPDDAWFYGLFRFSADGTGNTSILSVRSAGGTLLCAVRMNGSSAANIFANGADGTPSATTLSVNTTYHVWMHWVKGGTCEVFMSTSSTRPTVDGSGDVVLTKTSANTTATIFSSTSQDADYRIDKLRIDDEEIGNTPP